jgi:hypothetical protein
VTLTAGGARAIERPLTPAEAVAQAARDAAALPPAVAKHVRYLSLYAVPRAVRAGDAAVLSLHVNELSREPEITPPLLVPDTDGALLRISLRDYGIDPKVWERLADQDPYFHVQLVEEEDEYRDQEYGHWEGPYHDRLSAAQARENPALAHWVTTEIKREKTGAKVTRQRAALAPWLAETGEQREALAALVSATRSQAPVVDGRWLVWQTAIQFNRKPGYADFLDFKDEKGFQQLIGFDEKALERFPLELAEAVANSGVTRQPRAIERYAKVGGAYWRTKDVALALDRKNPLRVLDPKKNLGFDASEQLGHLPNGLLASGLFNSKGERQDFAPQTIALDRLGGANDLNVHLGTLSCNRCHTQAGFNDIKAWVRGVLNRPPLALNAADEEQQVRLRRLYTASLEEALADDRLLVERAVRRATGQGSKQAFADYARLWDEYAGTPWDAGRFARQLGVTRDEFVRALDRQVRTQGFTDAVLSTYLRPERVRELQAMLRAVADGPEPLPTDVAHEAFPLAEFALRGSTAPLEIKKGEKP